MQPVTKLLLSSLASASLIATAALAQTVADGGTRLRAKLTGAAEVPGPGDPDGSGGASVIVNPSQRRVCYELFVRNIDPATAAHIHVGAAGVAGPVVVNLSAPSDGSSSGCADVTAELAQNIRANPANYYVNVHNTPYPAGAVRGQLSGLTERRTSEPG